MDNHGWIIIDDLINKTQKFNLTYELTEDVVRTNSEKSFSISNNGKRIRANQGHTLTIDLELEEKNAFSFVSWDSKNISWKDKRRRTQTNGGHAVHSRVS